MPSSKISLASGIDPGVEPPTSLWCAREATVKASGRVGLKRIRAIDLEGNTARLDDHPWCLNAIDLSSDYAACLASDRPIGPVEFREFSVAGSENTGPQKFSDR